MLLTLTYDATLGILEVIDKDLKRKANLVLLNFHDGFVDILCSRVLEKADLRNVETIIEQTVFHAILVFFAKQVSNNL